MTFYTVFVIDLATRRVQVLGTHALSGRCVYATGRADTFDADGDACRVLICDRDATWSVAVRERLEEAGIRVVRTPYEAPNAAMSPCVWNGRALANSRLDALSQVRECRV